VRRRIAVVALATSKRRRLLRPQRQMVWFSAAAAAAGEEGEELQGLLDEAGSDGGNPSDANPHQADAPSRPSRRRGEVLAHAAITRAEAAAAAKRHTLEHLETIDWSCSRLETRRHEDVVEARIRAWPGLLRAIYRAYDAGQSWVALGVIGASCGMVASIIDTGTDWATDLKFGLCSRGFWISKATCCSDATDMQLCAAWNEWAQPGFFSFVCYVLIAVGMGSYSAWVSRLYPFACGSGLPEIKVIMGGFVMQDLFGLGTLLTKSMGLVLAVGAGLSIGKEGPFVHVAMCVAHVWSGAFSKYSANPGRNRELLASAAAAGVAVAFGAPVGGVLFSLEEVSSYFPPKTMWRAFWCAIVAVLTMQHLNQSGTSMP
jgi:chloride channel 3/4/5